jgi:general secretion pathway protein J
MMRRAGRQARGAAGFTLVEIMLAIAILTTMLTLVWASFSLTAKSKAKAEAISERYHQLRLAMHRMSREISMAFLSKNEITGTLRPRTMFVGKRESQIDELTFSSFAHMRLREDAKESDQSLITYFAAPDPEDRSRTNLMRRETRRLGVEKPGEEGPAYVMMEDVVGLHFEYFDATANEWREAWNTTSADGQADRLPAKIRILLTIRDEKDKEVTFRTATRTHLIDPLWFTPQ